MKEEIMNTTSQTPIEIALGIDETGATTAKKLYDFLELDKSHYSRWCNKNILRNPFAEEGMDYEILAQSGEYSNVGRPTQDYKLSVNFAKKLSMMCPTPKGEAAREYFLACEKLAKKAAEKELEKYKLLTLSPKKKFSIMHPKYSILEESLGVTRKELYKQIFKQIEDTYNISIAGEQVDYCYEHHISDCYPMTVLEDTPQLFLYLYDTVDKMLSNLMCND